MKKTKTYFLLRKWTYPFRRFISNIKRTWEYLPIIWGTYDFDYIYSLDMMIFQLERVVKYLESDKAYGQRSKWRASRGRLIINLYKKYREDYYALEPFDTMTGLYGDFNMNLEKVEDGSGHLSKGWKWEKAIDEKHNQELNETLGLMLKIAQKKQDKNNRLFWRAMEQYIAVIWD